MAKPNPALVSYIEKHLSKGVDIKRIKQKLAEVGHPIEAIEEAASFVTQQKPALKRKPKRFMIVYGIILILVLAGAGWYVWFKATQQVQYTETVQQIEQNRTYLGMTDVALLKLAASGDTDACSFIKDHNMYYACAGKYWTRDDCSYEGLLGVNEYSACREKLDKELFDSAMKSGEITTCDKIFDKNLSNECVCKINFGVSCEEHQFRLALNDKVVRFNDSKQIFLEQFKKDNFCSISEATSKFGALCFVHPDRNNWRDVAGLKMSAKEKSFALILGATKRGTVSDCNLFNQNAEILDRASVFHTICTAVFAKDPAACSNINTNLDITGHDLKNMCESWSRNSEESCLSNLCLLFFYI